MRAPSVAAGGTSDATFAIRHLGDMEAEFPHAYRRMLMDLTRFERGIPAHSELGQFQEALELCDIAITLDLTAHYGAKRDSLDWVRQQAGRIEFRREVLY